MTRKHAINDAAPSLVVTHGADFFGEDRHLVKDVAALAPWVTSSVSYVDRQSVAQLVAALEQPAARTFPAATAGLLAEQLLTASRQRDIKPAHAGLARALADAAARAAAAGHRWQWRLATQPGSGA